MLLPALENKLEHADRRLTIQINKIFFRSSICDATEHAENELSRQDTFDSATAGLKLVQFQQVQTGWIRKSDHTDAKASLLGMGNLFTRVKKELSNATGILFGRPLAAFLFSYQIPSATYFFSQNSLPLIHAYIHTYFPTRCVRLIRLPSPNHFSDRSIILIQIYRSNGNGIGGKRLKRTHDIYVLYV